MIQLGDLSTAELQVRIKAALEAVKVGRSSGSLMVDRDAVAIGVRWVLWYALNERGVGVRRMWSELFLYGRNTVSNGIVKGRELMGGHDLSGVPWRSVYETICAELDRS